MTPDTRVFSLFNFPVYLLIQLLFNLNILQPIKIKFDLIYLSVSITWILSTEFLNLKDIIIAYNFANTVFQASCIELCNSAIWGRAPEFSFLTDDDKTFVLGATSSSIQPLLRVHRKAQRRNNGRYSSIPNHASQSGHSSIKLSYPLSLSFMFCCKPRSRLDILPESWWLGPTLFGDALLQCRQSRLTIWEAVVDAFLPINSIANELGFSYWGNHMLNGDWCCVAQMYLSWQHQCTG